MKYAFNYGRMTPPTVGHEKVVAQMSKENDEVFLFLSPSYDSKKNSKNLIPFDGKVDLARDAFRDYDNVQVMTSKGTIIDACKAMELIATDNDEVYLYVGADRFDSMEKMIDRCNGKDFDIASISVKKVERDDDDVSATKVRDAIFHNDFNYFKKNTNYSDPKEFFSIIQAYLGTAEMSECYYQEEYDEFENQPICDFTCEALYDFDGVNSFIEKLTNIVKDRNIRVQLDSDCEELDQQLEDLILARDALLFEGYDKLYNKFCKELNLVDFLFKLDINSYDEFYFINENELISLLIKYCNHSNNNINLDEYLYDYDFISWVCIIINDILYVRYIMNQRPAYIESEEGISSNGQVTQINVNTNDTLLDSNGNEIPANDKEEFDDYEDEGEELKEGSVMSAEKSYDVIYGDEFNKDISDSFKDTMAKIGVNANNITLDPKENGGLFAKTSNKTKSDNVQVKHPLSVSKGSDVYNKLKDAADDYKQVKQESTLHEKNEESGEDVPKIKDNGKEFEVDLGNKIAKIHQSAIKALPTWKHVKVNKTDFAEGISAAVLQMLLNGDISTRDDIFNMLSNKLEIQIGKDATDLMPNNDGQVNLNKLIDLFDINSIFEIKNDENDSNDEEAGIGNRWKIKEEAIKAFCGTLVSNNTKFESGSWGASFCDYADVIGDLPVTIGDSYFVIAKALKMEEFAKNLPKEVSIEMPSGDIKNVSVTLKTIMDSFKGKRLGLPKDVIDKSDIYIVHNDDISITEFATVIAKQVFINSDDNMIALYNDCLDALKAAKEADTKKPRFFGISLKQTKGGAHIDMFASQKEKTIDPSYFSWPYLEFKDQRKADIDRANYEKGEENPYPKSVEGLSYISNAFRVLINDDKKAAFENALYGKYKKAKDELILSIRSSQGSETSNFSMEFKKNNNAELGKAASIYAAVYDSNGYKITKRNVESELPKLLNVIRKGTPEQFCKFISKSANLPIDSDEGIEPVSLPYLMLS